MKRRLRLGVTALAVPLLLGALAHPAAAATAPVASPVSAHGGAPRLCTTVVGHPLMLPPGDCPTPVISNTVAARPASSIRKPMRRASPDTTATPAWFLQQRSEPARRDGAQVVYDTAHGDILLFGGVANDGSYLDDTWVFISGRWSEMFPAHSPLPRYDGSIVDDANRHQVVLFGGAACVDPACDAAAVAGDTWTWDGSDWTQLSPASSPAPRWLAGMVYDDATQRTYLYGGCLEACATESSEVWSWNGTTWSLITADAAPGARAAVQMSYDAARGDVVLFGGSQPQTSATHVDLGDTWTFDGTAWTQPSPPVSPEGREGGGMAYDATRHAVVLYGGYSAQEPLNANAFHQDTWTWDGSKWTQQQTATTPGRDEDPSLVFDPSTGSDVLIGGVLFSIPVFLQSSGAGILITEKETWTLDASGWSEVAPTWPDDRSQDSLVYDPATGNAVLTGGFCLDQPTWWCNDMWTWDGARWTQPGVIFGGNLVAYDAASGQLVAFAGTAAYTWDGTRWTEHHNVLPADPYGQLFFPVIASDPSGHVIVFGGTTYDTSGRETDHQETLRWNGSGWDTLSPATSPPGRQLAQMALDPATGTTVLYGGIGCTPALFGCSTTYDGDTWTWDGSVWTQRHPASAPVNRAFASLAFDPSNQRLVLFGGIEADPTQDTVESDTWAWDGSTWTQQSPPTSPGTIFEYGFTTFPPSGSALLFGGQFDDPGWAISDQWLWGSAAPGGQVPETPAPWLLLAVGTILAADRYSRRRRRIR